MRPLILDNPTRMAIETVRQYALENTISLEHMLQINEGELPPPGDSPGFACKIKKGYRVVYTIEEQPGATVRHISISVDKLGSLPSVDAVGAIMEAFGMEKLSPEDDVVWIEKLTPPRSAVNKLREAFDLGPLTEKEEEALQVSAINVVQIISERQIGNA